MPQNLLLAHTMSLLRSFTVLGLLLGRVFRRTRQAISTRLKRRLPGPLAVITALLLTAGLFYSIGSGVLVRAAMHGFDSSYRKLDALVDDDSVTPPSDPLKTGAPGSLLRWEGLGHAGRTVVTAGPDRATIAAMTGVALSQAKEPLRV